MTYARSYTGWTVNSDYGHDFALLTLDRSIGNSTGWMGVAYYRTVNGLNGNTAGYPGDKGGVKMYYTSGKIVSSSATQLFYYIDTYPGQSGSSIYNLYNSTRYIFGINNVQWSSYNGGVRIDATKFNSIKSWMASGS
jgi:glutamyl endopeptidase